MAAGVPGGGKTLVVRVCELFKVGDVEADLRDLFSSLFMSLLGFSSFFKDPVLFLDAFSHGVHVFLLCFEPAIELVDHELATVVG